MNACRAFAIALSALTLAACSSSPSRPPLSDPPTSGGRASLSWTPVAEAEDGTPVEVEKVRLFCSTSRAGLDAAMRTTSGQDVPAPATSTTLTLPAGSAFCSAVVIARDGAASEPSNIAEATIP